MTKSTLPYFTEELSRTCLSLQDLAVMLLAFVCVCVFLCWVWDDGMRAKSLKPHSLPLLLMYRLLLCNKLSQNLVA